MKKVVIKNFSIGLGQPLTIMAGPCVIESEELSLSVAEALKKMFGRYSINLIFKSSYDKANRSSYDSFRGPGIEEGLRILQRVQREFDLPIITDVHTMQEAQMAGEVCEVLQIPAFLCRQTDLINAAALTGAVINVKKGQFLAPGDMGNVVKKIEATGNQQIILTDRGTTFGYNHLISDMRGIKQMQRFGYPVCFDATHSVQKPGSLGDSTGGDREFIPILAKSALAAGANCLFIEVHPHPEKAKSDAASVLSISELERLLPHFEALYELIQKQETNL